MTNIAESTAQYEDWLRTQLAGDVVKEDLERKHEKMRDSVFAFLRATYWRWAETVLEICPELANTPGVLAVGDIHLENFGTWRDIDGRLIWGVNDFDEAAEMPYALDLLRLATSGVIAGKAASVDANRVCASLLQGYRQGLVAPQPVVLDRDFEWLRELVEVSNKARAKFWKKLDSASEEPAPPRYRKALAASMPETGLALRTARRAAGAGSLGRPRWIAIADWRGAPVVREAKALLTSSWVKTHDAAKTAIRCGEIAGGRYRAHDPWFRIEDNIAVRRLSPNNRKIEAEDDTAALLSEQMLQVMGRDLAALHLGTADARAAIEKDLKARKSGWLTASAKKMAAAVTKDQKEWAAKP
jgi:hypothetical protein